MTDYIATEKDIRPTINNFEIFCRYIEERKPRLSKARGELGKKDCFEINALLSKPRGAGWAEISATLLSHHQPVLPHHPGHRTVYAAEPQQGSDIPGAVAQA